MNRYNPHKQKLFGTLSDSNECKRLKRQKSLRTAALSRSELLRPVCTECTGDFVKMQILFRVPGLGLGFCISNKLPSITSAVGLDYT